MTDAVTKITQETTTQVLVHMTCISDGTGETSVLKVDRSALTLNNLTSTTPSNLPIHSVRWSIQGFSSVRFLWDHTTDDVALTLSGNGYEEFASGIRDPNTSADTVTAAIGDVILTSVGAVSGATYDITLVVGKE